MPFDVTQGRSVYEEKAAFFICLILIVSGGYWYHSHSLAAKAEPNWQPVADGMELRNFTGAGNYGPAQILAIRIVPTQVRLKVMKVKQGAPPGARAEEVCPNPGAAINASFFAEKPYMQPLGLLICDGAKLQSRFPVGEWGTFLVTDKGADIIPSADNLPSVIKQAVEAKPRLLVDGKIPSFKAQPPARRSAVGLDAQGRVLLAACDGYLTLEQWAAIMKDDLNCVKALNLDGGPSTQLCVKGQTSQTVPGGWPVPVFITVEPK